MRKYSICFLSKSSSIATMTFGGVFMATYADTADTLMVCSWWWQIFMFNIGRNALRSQLETFLKDKHGLNIIIPNTIIANSGCCLVMIKSIWTRILQVAKHRKEGSDFLLKNINYSIFVLLPLCDCRRLQKVHHQFRTRPLADNHGRRWLEEKMKLPNQMKLIY